MRHCPPHIVEDGRSVGPEASHGFDRRLVTGERPLAAHELIVGLAGSLLAMTGKAFRRVHGFPLLWRSATWRQTNAVGTDADVPCGNFLRCCHPPEVRTFSRECNGRSHGET